MKLEFKLKLAYRLSLLELSFVDCKGNRVSANLRGLSTSCPHIYVYFYNSERQNCCFLEFLFSFTADKLHDTKDAWQAPSLAALRSVPLTTTGWLSGSCVVFKVG